MGIRTEYHKDKGINFIYSLIVQGEGLWLDFKFEISDAPKIARSLCAFANTQGGRLLVGVKDNGVVAGIRSEEEFYMVQSAASLYSKPIIKFNAHPWVINKKNILEVVVPISSSLPHYAPDDDKIWKPWVRIHDNNCIADAVMVEIWRLSKLRKGVLVEYKEPEQALMKYLDNNGSIDLDCFMRIALLDKKTAIHVLARLTVLSIIKMKPGTAGTIFTL